MVNVDEIYEIPIYFADWNSIVQQVQTNLTNGKETVIERIIDGEPVKCIVTGYSWDGSKKPFQSLKQKIKVQITERINA